MGSHTVGHRREPARHSTRDKGHEEGGSAYAKESETALKDGVLNTSLACGLCTAAAAAESLQSCPTLCDPRDGSPPGFPVPGILQARTLVWVAISFSSAGK